MSPTGLIKIIGALTPLMTDQTIGESMVAEIRQMFEHIEGTAHNLRLIAGHLDSINSRLANLEQKLREHIPTPLSDVETEKLIEYNGSSPAFDSTAYGEPIGDAN